MEPLRQDPPDRAPVAELPAWGPVKRASFRLLFCYLLLFNVQYLLAVVPVYGEVLRDAYMETWRDFPLWVGEHWLGVAIRSRIGGRGDATYTYLLLFCYLLLSVLATAVWTLLDRRRASYVRLHEWLRVCVRFALAIAMLGYGAYKVIPEQFGTPVPSELLQPIGDSSPMTLLWMFMGASIPYVIFTGAAEMLGGLLLVARRTTLLGALVCIGVLCNVVMLNLSYDVPVKIFSSHLLLMAVFLVAPDAGRLANLLVRNRRVPPAEQRPLCSSRRGHRAALVLRTGFVLYIAIHALHRSYENKQQYADVAARLPLYGVWEVEELAVGGVVRPLLATDKTLWRRLVFEWPGALGIQYAHQAEVRQYELTLSSGPHRFTLCCDEEWKAAALSFKRIGPDLLALEATVDGKPIRGRFRRMAESRFPLLSRGFRWINERPFDR